MIPRRTAIALLAAHVAAPAFAQEAPPDPEALFAGIAAEAGLDPAALARPDPGGPTLVSIDFDYAVPAPAFAAEMEGSAVVLAAIPGLVWKVWSHDPATGAANGTYLFASEDAARFYVERVFPQGPPSREGYGDFDIRVLDVMDGPSRLTRAPLD